MQQRLARGEEAALGELYDRFFTLVHHLSYKITEDPETAEEVTTEVFAHLWQRADQFDPLRHSMRSWIAALTGEKATCRLRKTEYLAQRDSPDAVEAKVRAASAAARADYIVASMPAPLQRALEQTYIYNRSYCEVAKELDISQAEARRRLRLGLQLLSTAADSSEARL